MVVSVVAFWTLRSHRMLAKLAFAVYMCTNPGSPHRVSLCFKQTQWGQRRRERFSRLYLFEASTPRRYESRPSRPRLRRQDGAARQSSRGSSERDEGPLRVAEEATRSDLSYAGIATGPRDHSYRIACLRANPHPKQGGVSRGEVRS